MKLKSVVLLITLIASGCQTTPKIDAATLNAVMTYYPAQVSVTQSANFSSGLVSMGDVTSQQLADKFAAESQARLASELPAIMRGSKPANIVILLQTASISSGAGRAVLGTDSFVDATISIVDASTGTTVGARSVHAIDAASSNDSSINGIPVGALLSLAVNASQSDEQTRIAKITEAFLIETKRQLGGK